MGSGIDIKSLFSNVRNYFILCLVLIAIGLSLSKPLITLGLFGLLIVWLADGNIKLKLKAFYNNKIALMISSVYLLTLLGLLYTSNYNFAIDDVRRKMPLFFLPFYFSGFSPLTKKEFSLLIKIYIVGVLLASFWSFYVYMGGLHITIVDVRDYSRFNSHIRFGLEIALALFFSFHYIVTTKKLKLKLMWLLVAVWLLCSLFIFNLFTGMIVFIATIFLMLLVFGLITKNKRLKLLFLSLFAIIGISTFLFIKNVINDFYSCNDILPLKEIPYSKFGGKYQKDGYTDSSTLKENGYYVEKNITWIEFAEAWNKRSKISFEGEDLKGQKIKNTLIRFITSKGQRKDKEAIDNLSDEEVKAIEEGIPNYKYLIMDEFSVRLHKIIWEYDSYINNRNINGHSVLMRWEYWKTAVHIIKGNWLSGVGTGDVQDAFDLQYEKDKSLLEPKYRLRAHNQYLTYGVTFGIIGLSWFFFFLFYPVIKTKMYKNYFYVAFFIIAVLSMLTEDTLETQVGINFFVFFNTILLLSSETQADKSVVEI